MKLLKNMFFCFLFVLGFAAVANAEDTIYLKDGSVVHGTVIKKFPATGSIKVRKDNGKEVVYKKKQVLKVEHSGSTSEKPKAEHSAMARKHEHHHWMEATGTIDGVNNIGRPGYFFSDTAFVPNKGQIMGSAGVAFYSPGSQLIVPVGAAYGITDEIQLHADINFYTGTGISGLGNLTVGGKYKFHIATENLLIAAGLDLSDGPLTGSGFTSFNIDPYGIVTYSFVDGLQLNCQLGVYIPTTGTKIGAFTYTPPSYLQLNAGAAYAFDKDLTGIAELDINGQGSGATPIVVGIRTGHAVQLQAFGGLDLAGTVGVLVGGNIALVSE